jgi:septal ring factor EnvC (AmiA/AmiB activator)
VDGACHTDLELTSRSGAVAPVALVSDGDHVVLRFAKEGAPAEAFLPIRIDQKPFANLVQRTGEEGLALMRLSDETLGAMKRGKTLQIAWLSDEAVSGSLAGAAQGIADLRTCGAQVAAQQRAHEAQLEVQRARAAADARAKALADEQLKAARAQTAAAQAERDRLAAETRKANAQAEALAGQAEQSQAYAEQERQRRIQAERERAYAQQYYYRDRPPPPPDPYGSYYRPYYPR